MRLEGSCHCKKVSFSLQSSQPVPYQRCYCSICRKTGGGFMINLGGDAETLQVEGAEFVRGYRSRVVRDGEERVSGHERSFCGECGSHLYAINDHWPQLVHPVASALDSPLPPPEHSVHMMMGSKVDWLQVDPAQGDQVFDEYPEQSLADWHKNNFEDGK